MSKTSTKKAIAPEPPKRPTENFDVDLAEARLQLNALCVVEDLSIRIAEKEKNLAKQVDVERITEILDMNEWSRVFSPTLVADYRDINGLPLEGKNYSERMETIFDRFLNSVAHYFACVINNMTCEDLCASPEWCKLYETLAFWRDHLIYFPGAVDPFHDIDKSNGLDRLDELTTQ